MIPTDQLAVFVVGIIWPYLFQVLGKFHLAGRTAQWAVTVSSFVIAAVVIVVSGQKINPSDLLSGGGILLATSQVVYRQLIKDQHAAPKA